MIHSTSGPGCHSKLVIGLAALLALSGSLFVPVSDSVSEANDVRRPAERGSTRGPGARGHRQKGAPSTLILPARQEEELAHGDEDVNGRSDWFTFERAYPFSSIPAGARRRAWEARGKGRVEAQSVREDASTTWQTIGPSPTSSAFANLGIHSGRINSIAISPLDPQVILVGGGTGGVWRSTDGGATFVPVSDDQVDLAVGGIVFAKSNPFIVYAGMGDTKNGYLGSGVMKSTDGGRSWQHANNSTLPPLGTVSDIEVDPTDPNRVYLAQYSRLGADNLRFSSGFWVSTDGGVNWVRTLAGLPRDIAIDAANPRAVYAAMARVDQPQDAPAGLYRSTDSGTTWSILYTSPYDLNRTTDARVAVTPANPQAIYFYIGGTIAGAFSIRVAATTDGGATWALRPTAAIDPGQFGYNTYIAADPTNANTVYVGARDLYKSTDGGNLWRNLTQNYTNFEGTFIFTPGTARSHADQHALTFAPRNSNEIYLGNDGGISRSTDGGATFQQLNQTLSLTQFISIAIHPTNPAISYGGSQDNGTQRRLADGLRWFEFVSGDGGNCVINPLDPSIVLVTYIRGDIFRFYGDGVYFDKRIGSNWTFGEPDNGARILFYPPFSGNGVDSTLYFGTWRLFTSTDLGDTWAPPAGDLDLTKGVTTSGRDVLSAIGVSRSNANVIYTGSGQGRAMLSTDAGRSWSDITSGLPNRFIKSITVDPSNPAIAYLTLSGFGTGHVFKTTSSGAAWTDISGNLPDIPTNTLLIDPISSTTLYIGTDIGVFRSIRGDGDWQLFNSGMPPVIVNKFSAQATGLIQVATYGRGAYQLDVGTRPAISSVVRERKNLTIAGVRFGANPSVIINDRDRTSFIASASETLIKLKGKSKKLGLKSGDNTIQVIDATGASNVFILRL